MAMIDKLNVIFQRYNEVNDLIIQPDVISDSKRYVQLNREYKNLKPLVEVRLQYLELSSRIEEAKGVLKEEKDADFREMAKMELDELDESGENGEIGEPGVSGEPGESGSKKFLTLKQASISIRFSSGHPAYTF